MTFKADLQFSNSSVKYNVLECDYDFSQEIDVTGKPCAKPKCNIISVLFETKADPEMIQWMLASGSVRSGEINFYSDDTMAKKLKTLSFKKAICIRLQERFSSSGSSPMMTTISFVAKEISLDGADYAAQWTNF